MSIPDLVLRPPSPSEAQAFVDSRVCAHLREKKCAPVPLTRLGVRSMKKVVACALFSAVALSSISGCGGGASGASAPVVATPAAVTGVQTPKSVSVVTAT